MCDGRAERIYTARAILEGLMRRECEATSGPEPEPEGESGDDEPNLRTTKVERGMIQYPACISWLA